MAYADNIRLKKKYGQHFLEDHTVVAHILDAVTIHQDSNIFEIGSGSGILTEAILKRNPARLLVFEIDDEWVNYLKNKVHDERLLILHQDFLTADLNTLDNYKPWILLANLPYNITFPILHRLYEYRHLLREGVIMVQEEVAQKLTKKNGKNVGALSLFFQYYFSLKLREKIPPTAFNPPPKVFSRLVYFAPRFPAAIPDEKHFWEFIKVCFAQPRRTLTNNIRQSNEYRTLVIPESLKALRAQQLSMEDFLSWWNDIRCGISS